MRRYNLEGIVLKKIALKDADSLYTILTKEKGKVAAIAKGVRKISSRRGGNLDTLNHVLFTVSENNAGYKYISEVKSLKTYPTIKRSLELSLLGYYFAELVHRSTEEEDSHPQVFFLLRKTLDYVEKQPKEGAIAKLFFELNLLRLHGYFVQTDRCVVCHRPLGENWGGFWLNYAKKGLSCECSPRGNKISYRSAVDICNISRGLFSKVAGGGNIEGADSFTKNIFEEIIGKGIKTPTC